MQLNAERRHRVLSSEYLEALLNTEYRLERLLVGADPDQHHYLRPVAPPVGVANLAPKVTVDTGT
jgi:hypothetical protein